MPASRRSLRLTSWKLGSRATVVAALCPLSPFAHVAAAAVSHGDGCPCPEVSPGWVAYPDSARGAPDKKDGASRASSLHDTQRKAEAAAKAMLKSSGGGELKVKGEDGRIRSKDTIAPGNDPNPPKDKEH